MGGRGGAHLDGHLVGVLGLEPAQRCHRLVLERLLLLQPRVKLAQPLLELGDEHRLVVGAVRRAARANEVLLRDRELGRQLQVLLFEPGRLLAAFGELGLQRRRRLVVPLHLIGQLHEVPPILGELLLNLLILRHDGVLFVDFPREAL